MDDVDDELAKKRRANVTQMRRALDDHNSNRCPVPARAFLMNPEDFADFRLTAIWGLPVLPDLRQRPGFFRVDCEGSAANIEQELEREIRSRETRTTTQPAPVDRAAA